MFEVFLDIPAQAFLEEAGESMYSRVRKLLRSLPLIPFPRGQKE